MEIGKMNENGVITITKTMDQKDLTSDCWAIQMWGLDQCIGCEYLNTPECGGQEIRNRLLKGNDK